MRTCLEVMRLVRKRSDIYLLICAHNQTDSRAHFAVYYDKSLIFVHPYRNSNIILDCVNRFELKHQSKNMKEKITGYTKEWINYRARVKRFPPEHPPVPVTLLAEKRGRRFHTAV